MSVRHESDLERQIADAFAERADSLGSGSGSGFATSGRRTDSEDAGLAALATSRPSYDELPSVSEGNTSDSRRASRVFAAAAAVVILGLAGAVVINHDRPRGGAATTASSPAAPVPVESVKCSLSGVSPDGRTRGTVPTNPSDGPRPDFIAVTSADQTVGYMNAERLSGGESSAPVYDCDLSTVVGHLVANKGFVPIGVDPASVPQIEDPRSLQHVTECIQQRTAVDC